MKTKSILVTLAMFSIVSNTAEANWLVGLGTEYRFLHFYGQSTGVPTYRGFTLNPEIKKEWGDFALYGGYGFGLLPNTANSPLLKEDFKYRAFNGGLELIFSPLFVRLGVVKHYSKDEVSGANVRTITFNGWGGHLGTGITGYLTSAIQFQLGVDMQYANFEPDSTANLSSRKDMLSYCGYLKFSYILTSAKRAPKPQAGF